MIELGGQVLRDVLYSVAGIPVSINIPQKILTKNLKPDQLAIVHSISSKGSYDDCDVTLLYFLIRNLCGPQFTPTNGKWGKPPNQNHHSVGDDIERLRILRNTLFGHIAALQINDLDYKSNLKELKSIFARFDTCHNG